MAQQGRDALSGQTDAGLARRDAFDQKHPIKTGCDRCRIDIRAVRNVAGAADITPMRLYPRAVRIGQPIGLGHLYDLAVLRHVPHLIPHGLAVAHLP